MAPERVSLFCLKMSNALGVPIGIIERACEEALGEEVKTTVLHSGVCPNCKADIAGPIANSDDVKWSLGHWILSGALEHQPIEDLVAIAKEQIEMLELQAELKVSMEKGFLNGYFSPHLREDIKNVIEKMDKISDGPRRAVDRSHEQLSVLQCEKHDAVAGVECDAGNPLSRESEEDSVEPDVFPPPSMFRMD